MAAALNLDVILLAMDGDVEFGRSQPFGVGGLRFCGSSHLQRFRLEGSTLSFLKVFQCDGWKQGVGKGVLDRLGLVADLAG